MLESIRQGIKKPIFKIVLGALIVSFVFAGVFTSSVFTGDPNAAAIVNGDSVSRMEFDRAYNIKKSLFGDNFNLLVNTEAKEKQFRQVVLEELVTQKLQEQNAQDIGLRISKERIKQEVHKRAEFQKDGKFSAETARQLLSRVGMTPESYEAGQAASMATSQFLRAISESAFALGDEVNSNYQLQSQVRDAQALRIPAQKFEADIQVSEEELNDFYASHKQDYAIPEQVVVEYLDLNINSLRDSITVTDEEVEEYYQQSKDSFKTEEQRRVAHILISVAEDAGDEEVATAKAKIDELVEKINTGEDFSELAKANSNDDFSAQNGGDLDFVSRGQMVPEFEEAMFALQEKEQISDVVRSSYGFHVIKLLDIKAEEIPPMEDVTADIEQAIKAEKADEEYFRLEKLLAEKSFEFSDTLADAAEATGLEVKTSPNIPKTGGIGTFANPAVVEAVFSDLVLQEKRNSDPIELGEQHQIVVHLKQHTPSSYKTFEEVKEELEKQVKTNKASDKAAELGEQIIAQLKKGESIEALLQEHQLEWQQAAELTRTSAALGVEIRDLVFKMTKPEEDKVSIEGNKLANGDYAVMELKAINNGDLEKLQDTERKQMQQRIARYFGETEYRSYLKVLREGADVKLKLEL